MSFDKESDFFNFWSDEQSEPEWQLKEGERRDVAVLFADVHGFTEMSTRHDPEVVHLKMDELMKAFSKWTRYYGGFVDKYVGDCIMSLFGAKVASENDTERAILTGLKMIHHLKFFNSVLKTQPQFKDEELSIRIGINTGLVSVGKIGEAREGDFTVYGNTVNLASRMESSAPLNQIMVPVEIKQTVEHLFEFERVGYVQAKGIEQPVEAFIVKGVKAERAYRWSVKKTSYIGRRNEIALLQNIISTSLKQCKDPEQKTYSHTKICITGEAGIGKSRILFETLAQQQSNFIYLSALSSNLNPAPMNTFTTLLENFFHVHVNQPIEIKKKKLEEGLAALSSELDESCTKCHPELVGERSDLDNLTPCYKEALEDAGPLLGYLLEITSPDIRLQQKGKDMLIHIQHAILTLIEALLALAVKRSKPLVLSWDDLHWADDSALLTLDYLYQSKALTNTQSQVPILTFMLYRDWDCKQDYFDKLVFDQKIALTALKDSEIMQLIKQQSGHMELPQSTIDKVKELSDGNPFYLEEWCNYIYNLPRYETKEFPVPTNLHALVLSRLDRLTEAVKLLLQKASVIGQEFFVEILHEIEKRLQSSDDTDKTLSDLEEQSLILKMLGFDYSAYFFKHITTREVAYQTLLQVNRKVLHQLTAEAIESIYPDRLDEFLFALAEHYQRAEVYDKATLYTSKAAAIAAKNYSNAQAIKYYDHLLTILPESESTQRADTLLKKADICWLTGQYNDADKLINQALLLAEEINDQGLLFEAYRQRGIASFYREEMPQAKQDFDQCLALATVVPAQAGTHAVLKDSHPEPVEGQPVKTAGHPEPVEGQPVIPAQTAGHPEPVEGQPVVLAQAGILNNNERLAVAYGNLGIWHQHTKDYDTAMEYHHKSLDFARLQPEQQRIAKTLNNLGMIYLSQEKYDEAIDYFKQCLSISEINRYLKEESIALGNIGTAYQKQNNFDEAKRYYERKWLLCEKMGDQPELIKVLGNIGNLHRDKGEHREALEYYRNVLKKKEMLGNPKELGITHNVIALELYDLNLFSEALVEMDKAIDYAADFPNNLCGYYYYKAVILLDAGETEQAKAANRQALQLAIKLKKQHMIDACNGLSDKINRAD